MVTRGFPFAVNSIFINLAEKKLINLLGLFFQLSTEPVLY